MNLAIFLGTEWIDNGTNLSSLLEDGALIFISIYAVYYYNYNQFCFEKNEHLTGILSRVFGRSTWQSERIIGFRNIEKCS